MIQLLPRVCTQFQLSFLLPKCFTEHDACTMNQMNESASYTGFKAIWKIFTAGGFCYSLSTLVLLCLNAHKEKIHIYIEIQSLSVPFRDCVPVSLVGIYWVMVEVKLQF